MAAEVNGFAYSHSEELGNAFEYLLQCMGTQGENGQFRTPRHIIDFIVACLDPQPGDAELALGIEGGVSLVEAQAAAGYLTDAAPFAGGNLEDLADELLGRAVAFLAHRAAVRNH